MAYVMSIAFSLLEMAFFWTFLSGFFSAKQPAKMFFLAALISCAAIIPINLFEVPDPFKTVIALAMNIGFSLWLFRGPWYWHVLLVMVAVIFNAVLDTLFLYASMWILGLSYEALVWKKLLYSVIITASKLIAIFLAGILARFKRPGAMQGKQIWWVLLTVLFPAVSMGMLMFVFYAFRDQPDLSSGGVIFSVLVALANIAILYMISAMQKAAHQEQKNALLHQQVTIQTESMMALEKNYHAQRKQTHEHVNQLLVIQGLLSEGNIDQAKLYIAELCQSTPRSVLAVRSGHSMIDAILNQKYTVATEDNIDVHISLNDLSGVTLKPETLVVLLGNLWDNAIEACRKLPKDRAIRCTIVAEDTLYLSVRNTSLPVEIRNGTIATTKDPRADHGFGLEHILDTAKALHAEYVLRYDNGWFCFAAEIPEF